MDKGSEPEIKKLEPGRPDGSDDPFIPDEAAWRNSADGTKEQEVVTTANEAQIEVMIGRALVTVSTNLLENLAKELELEGI